MEQGSNIQATVFAVIFSLMFLLFLNGEIGSVLLYIAVGVSVLAFVLLCVSKKHFTARLRGLSGTVECGRTVEFEVILEKKGFCFIPFVEVCVDAEESLRLRTSLLFRKTVSVKGSFVPKHSGLNKVVLEKVIIGDFLGNGKFTVNVAEESQLAVFPQVVEYDGPEVLPNMLPSEEEEAEEGVSTRQGGMPGYEHREYVPGDSPRRVNYKLSAKRGKLMVRLDESNGYAATNLLITENGLPSCCDKAFALARQLVIRGGTVKIIHRGDERIASTPETLDRMREWLAFREYARELVPAPLPADRQGNIVFAGDGQIFVQN
ncbi:MAG: DUF58 domain-containing protein [Oscillospiraceae bacterium]